MFSNAQNKLQKKIKIAYNWETFMKELNKKQILKTPWCTENECEDKVK